MISAEHTSYLYALWTDDPAAGTAVIIGIDIDSDSMVDIYIYIVFFLFVVLWCSLVFSTLL